MSNLEAHPGSLEALGPSAGAPSFLQFKLILPQQKGSVRARCIVGRWLMSAALCAPLFGLLADAAALLGTPPFATRLQS